jgi:hypothetical protein
MVTLKRLNGFLRFAYRLVMEFLAFCGTSLLPASVVERRRI